MTDTIEIDSRKIHAALHALSDTLDDMTPIMKKIAGAMLYAVEENFETEGAHLGKRWKPSKRAIMDGGKTLQDTGRLAGSMTTDAGRDYAIVGTNVEYAPKHQYGRGRGVIARPFLGINSNDEDQIIKIIHRAMTRATEGMA